MRTSTTDAAIGRWQTGVVAALVIVVPAALWMTADPVGVVKWTLLVAGSVGLVGLLVAGHLRTGRTVIHERRGLLFVAAFLAAVLVVAVTSESGWLALLGEYTYYQGVVTFLALAVVLVAVLASRADPTATLLRATTVAAGLAGLLTAGQFVGIEWFGYEPRMFGRVATTLGNSNFGAAFLAITLPAVLHQVFFGSKSDVERWLSAATGVIVAVEAVAIGSVQGPITALVAVVVWLALVGVQRVGLRRTALGLAGGGLLAGVVVALLWSPIYDEISDSVQIGRQGAWVSAWEQFTSHPFLGVGLDHFGENYTAYRPAFSPARPSERFTDAGQAHNVILDLLADGGLVLGIAYTALVLYTGYRAISALRRLHGSQDLSRYHQLAAVFSVWVAYQAQAQVSIDHVPLALVHWVFMGLIFRLSSQASGAEPVVLETGRRRRSARPGPVVAVIAGCLAVLWFALIPIRADYAAGAAARLGADGRLDEAIDEFETATSLMSFRSHYWIQRGLQVQAARGAVAAAPFMERGATLDEGNSRIALLLGEYYVAVEDDDAASRWYEEAVDRDPYNPEVLGPAADFHDAVGDDERASQLRRRLEALPPEPEG